MVESIPSRHSVSIINPGQLGKENVKPPGAPKRGRPQPVFNDPDLSPIIGPGRQSVTQQTIGESPILRESDERTHNL